MSGSSSGSLSWSGNASGPGTSSKPLLVEACAFLASARLSAMASRILRAGLDGDSIGGSGVRPFRGDAGDLPPMDRKEDLDAFGVSDGGLGRAGEEAEAVVEEAVRVRAEIAGGGRGLVVVRGVVGILDMVEAVLEPEEHKILEREGPAGRRTARRLPGCQLLPGARQLRPNLLALAS